ncbi:hypothetical protein HMPREF0973_01120 [Prevotella veroralis F0319]|uniref:Uncharacterized protein n=1 Tax=Prevotella veroralis F0319 TaxID=649761 RepID=C9MND3_9BACT|nr:hypothetical protein HMPREF0973_01120 [Prevotella veroralis F0319]
MFTNVPYNALWVVVFYFEVFLFKKTYFENWCFVWIKMVFKWLFELMYVK